MRKILVAILALVILLGAGYASLPWLVNVFVVPRLIDQAGLDALELEIGYPGLEHLNIGRLHLRTQTLVLDASNIELSYNAQSLRNNRLDKIRIEQLALAVLIPETDVSPVAVPTGDGQPPAQAPALDAMLGLVPADRVAIVQFEVAVPSLEFLSRGSITLDETSLEARLTGLRPAIARDLNLVLEVSRTGVLQLSLQDPDPEQPSSIQLLGKPDGTQLAVHGDFSMAGYGLSLIQEIAGMPQGTGKVSGELATNLPWPLAALPDWQTLEGTASLDIEWSLADPSISLNDVTAAIELEKGEIRIRPQGKTRYSTKDVDVTGVLAGGRYTFHDGRLSSTDPRLTLLAENPDLSAQAELHEALLTVRPLAVELTGSVQIDLEPAQIEGDLATTLVADGQTLEGTYDFAGNVDASALMDLTGLRDYPVHLDGGYALLDDLLAIDGNLTTGPITGLPFKVAHNLGNATGTLTFSYDQTISDPLLQKLLPGLQAPYDLDSGRVAMSGELAWKDQLSGTIEIRPEALRAYYDDYTLINAAGKLTFTLTDAALALLPSRLFIEGIDIGTPLTNVELRISGTLDRLRIDQAVAELLGGHASVAPFDYQIEPGEAEFSVALSDLDLAEVLALQGDSVSGTGRLSGTIPVTLRDNTVQIEGGEIGTSSPGRIALSPTLTAGITQPGLDIAITALQNFNYEALSANVDYDSEGNMLLGVRLEGSNPDLEDGRPVHFNLNISENIPVLLKSLRLQDNFTKTLERRVKQ